MDLGGQQIVVGRVVSPFGVRGEVKLLVLTDFPERFDAGKRASLRLADGTRRDMLIESKRPYKDGLLVRFQGVHEPEAAEALRNAEIIIDSAELKKLPDGSFYVFDIIGLSAVTEDGRGLGDVVEIIQAGANDVYVTSTGLCIPALKDVIARIDLDRGVMVVRPVPGLLAEEEDAH